MAKQFGQAKLISPTQRKVSHKGKACRRGQPIYYDQVKQPINLSLTPDAIAHLEDLAAKLGCSRSEAVERWLRNNQPLESASS